MAGRTGDYLPDLGKWSNVIYMPCTKETNFAPELPKETPDIIYLCFPNNPTGATITKSELQRWVDYANKVGAVIIYDAAYEAYISEDDVAHTIYECEGARTCAIELRSFSKNAGFTGTRLGFTVIPKDLKCGDVMLHSLWARRHGTKFNGAPYIIQRAGAAIYTEEGQKQTKSMIDYYMNLNPDFASEYTVKCCVLSTSNGYTDLLDNGLEYGGSDGPDIYVVEGADVMEYSQGNMCNYAMSYEDLGIDIDSEIAAADIAQYTVDIGTNPNGEVVALGYQATGGAMIYRRSIAQDVFGTDDPDEISAIFGGGTGSWDAFWDAADVLKDNGVAVVSGTGDIWQVIYGSTDSWIKDGSLDTSSDRYEFFDMAYDLYDGGYTNNTGSWTEEWYDDMNGTGERPVFAFFGPAWLMNYVMAPNCYDTYGDWAVCTPPVGFMWGGSWVFASANTDQADGVRDLIYWITLDTSTEGLQYL
jgi:hypothetical protein